MKLLLYEEAWNFEKKVLIHQLGTYLPINISKREAKMKLRKE